MKLKNYQEDVVLRAIEIAMEDQPDLLSDENFVKDVAAYVLNRVPPRYVMSERGFLRLALEHLEEEQQDQSLANVIELMMLVNRGVELVQGRRHEPPTTTTRVGADHQPPIDGAIEYVHNYPQIIGRVVDAETGKPVYDATVSLLANAALLPQAARGWRNPYVTREQTRGHFSFWPQAIQSLEPELSLELVFSVEHAEYRPYKHVERITTEGTYDAAETIRGDKVLSLQPFVVEKVGGEREPT